MRREKHKRAKTRKARVPKRSAGADWSVVAMKARNGAGAKGSDQAVVWSKQLATGGCRCVRQTSRSISPRGKCTRPIKAVKSNGGAAGVDGQTIEQFEADLQNNLYKLWNRMSSGSYFPPPVRAVSIPKKSGGQRIWVCPPWQIEWLRWWSSSSLSRTWSRYFWQTHMVIGRGNRALRPLESRASDAGDMIGF